MQLQQLCGGPWEQIRPFLCISNCQDGYDECPLMGGDGGASGTALVSITQKYGYNLLSFIFLYLYFPALERH